MVWEVFSSNIFHIRNYGKDASSTFQERLSRYSVAHPVEAWTIGDTANLFSGLITTQGCNPVVNDLDGPDMVSTNWRKTVIGFWGSA